jgi:chromosome segregation protein
MRIKRVEIIGFKSFCDRAVINIDAHVIAVVGPNGCGKSNIVDAIRWCMGEQSAKHLRGKAMEDVIFAGSESRGPAPMAEVSLTFDDVGFSHETLELALKSDAAEAERAIDQVAPVDPTPDAQTDDGEPAEAVLDEHGAPMQSAAEAVRDFLADDGRAIDFTRYTEVTITRRLFRDGTSLYMINKTPCRLRDVTDFFLGTGVGTKAYSIIEQGRIGQIVSARPQDRRAIIEEAAGITKFKAKKKAAERKLEQTRQNLLRVSDIVVELDKRMGTLRRQAQKAERFRKYKAELKDLELWRASHRYLELRGEDQLVGARLDEVRAERDDARAAFDVKDAHVVAERAELAIEERRLAGVQNAVYDLDNRIQLADSKIGFERREADDLEARVAGAEGELAELAAQRAAAAIELAAREDELAALSAEVAREDDEVAVREAAAGEARALYERTQLELDRARGQLATSRTEVATVDAQLAALAHRRTEAEVRHARVVEEAATTSSRMRDLDRELRRVDGALAEARQTRLDLGVQQDGFSARAEVLAEQVGRGEAQVETLRTEVHRRRSRLVSLVEIQQRYEGFARGTRAVMQHRQMSADDADAVKGLVADVVRAPETLEVAVEAALGDSLGGVLVRDAEVGVRAIDYLKQASAGRSTFVPVSKAALVAPAADEVRLPGIDEAEAAPMWGAVDVGWGAPEAGGGIQVEDRTQLNAAQAAIGGEGIVGRMTELVEFADGYQAIGRHLLAGYVVVDSLARAVALHDAGVTETLVTLDGDLVDPRGVVSGGSREAMGAGVLAQKREIRELEEIVSGLEHDLAEATATLVSGKAELKQLTKAIEGLRGQVHQGDLTIIGHEKDHGRIKGELDRVRDRLGQMTQEELELEDRLAAMGAEDRLLVERRTEASLRIGRLEIEEVELAATVTTSREQVDALTAELTAARIRAAQLGEKRASVEAHALRLAQAHAGLELRADKLRGEAADARARAEALRAGCERLAAEVAELTARRREEAGVLEAGRTGYERRFAELTAVELAARELRARADRAAAEVGQLELRAGQIAMNRQNLADTVAERHQVDLRGILHEYHLRGLAGEVEDRRLAELRDLIERMGTDINLTAIDEFADVSQRFEFLSTQKTDLESAVDQLQRAIDKINKTSRRLFKDTFTAVNDMFKQVFPRLFRGGHASLSLAGGDDGTSDVLEAGIEIMAQPPGKKNTTVDQLSGGEKALTAVALIFSIFMIKPSPFCILDEVDAPLDEANVDRYNELVRQMTDRSQFIVITHNKRSMESADNLYGVTMQEPGVSKLVTVNLSKVA